MTENSFRKELVKVAAQVMRCEYCRSHAQKVEKDDVPQPGWVGAEFKPGHDAVILLQNPAVRSESYGDERELAARQPLRRFERNPTTETHSELMRFMLADMAGETGRPPWPIWTHPATRWPPWRHPVSKLVIDRGRLAWLNVVKYRTPENRRPNAEEVNHGVQHLWRELQILRPKALVVVGSVGREAKDALADLGHSLGVTTYYLGFRCSEPDAKSLATKLVGSKVEMD